MRMVRWNKRLVSKRHRLDGPAIEHADGNQWFINGRECTEQYILAIKAIIRFRARVKLFKGVLGFNLSRLLDLSKTRAINEWYYHPNNGGGKLLKARALSTFEKIKT